MSNIRLSSTLCIFLLLSLIRFSLSSYGDSDLHFQNCIKGKAQSEMSKSAVTSKLLATANYYCNRKHSQQSDVKSKAYYDFLSRINDLLSWNDEDDCKYYCMFWITHIRREFNLPTLKYYGHWPYVRVFGIQEPASMLFSIMNTIPHILSLLFSSYYYPIYSSDYVMKLWLQLYTCVAINAWVAASLYHYRLSLKFLL